MPEFRALLSENSVMAQRIRAFDWSQTPLGPPENWPQSLRSALSICLNNIFPTAIYWGPDLRLLYNDAWAPIPGPRHPGSLGKSAREVWPDIWHVIEPQLQSVLATGKGFATFDEPLPMQRYGRPEETYWSYSFTPIAGEDGRVAGVFNLGQETTTRILEERRNRLSLVLSDRLRALELPGDITTTALQTLSEHMSAMRLLYGEVDQEHDRFRIEACWTDGAKPVTDVFQGSGWGNALEQAFLSGETLVIDDVENDPRIKDKTTVERYRLIGVGAVAVAPVVRNGRFSGALAAHQSGPHNWTAGEIALLEGTASRLWQELTRSRGEMALRESERRLRLVFEQARDIIFTADLDQTIVACNPAAARAIGLPAEDIVRHSISEFLAPGEFERTTAMLKRKLIEGGTTRYEVAVRTADGRICQWDINSALTIDTDGHPIGLHAVARDVTEQRAYDEQQQLLINELNHRVKNTLALVQGLALQSFKSDRSFAEGQEAFQARLAMLAAAHDLLTREMWEGATVTAIAMDATAPYADPPGRISIEGPRVLLTPKAAISLVLALHELGTNAAKYGALSVPEGKISLKWSIDAERNFKFIWRESGGPTVQNPSYHGFGLKMLERALARDLNGNVDISFVTEGLVCTISATLSEPA